MRVVSLVLPLLFCVLAVPVSAQLPVDLGPADQNEVNAFALTKETLAKVLAINASVASDLAKDRSWRQQLALEAKTPAEQTIAEAVKRLRTHARVITWLRDTGLEQQIYIVAQLALMQAAVMNDNVKAGLARRPKPEAGALLGNLAFVEENAAEVRRFMKGIEEISTMIDEEGK